MDSVQAVSEMLPDGLVVVDEHEMIRFVNRRAEEILVAQHGDLVGRPVREGLPLTDSDGNNWWDLTDPWHGLATRKGHREKLLWTPAGVEVLVTARYIRRGRGAPVHRVVMAFRDALARQRTEQDHAALISTLAHELRSPLTSVKGFSSTVLKHWERFSDEQKRFIIETIEADAERVTRLIADLLDVSRIDSGRLNLRREVVSLDPIVERNRHRLEALGYTDGRIVVRSGGTVPTIWADPDRLDQIVLNLLENALKHGDGQVTVTVDSGRVDMGLEVDPDGREAVVVSVVDEGLGIPEKQRAVVFSRFWHSKGAGNTGLGLYVVRALVEAHGGRIVALSATTGGAELRFSIPAGEPEALHRDAEAAAGRL
jgi:signal transduction histidine kinase